MARKIQSTIVAGILILAIGMFCSTGRARIAVDQTLVNFGFDDGLISSDASSFRIWESGKGSVRPMGRFSFSGFRSLEISDQAGDKDFPELQGYFSLRKTGKIYFRFALMVTNPTEELNVALAGPAGFILKKDAIAFWLSTKEGWIYHTTDSIPTKLFKPKASTWYVFKMVYDIDRGLYDLLIAEERQEKPFIALKNQLNASHEPGSAIDKLSFIGDKGEDSSNTLYYVDDVLLGTTKEIVDQKFAPSTPRRSFFIDGWYELKKASSSQPRCPTVFEASEFDFQSAERAELKAKGLLEKIKTAAYSWVPITVEPSLTPRTKGLLQALNSWVSGCQALKAENAERAEQDFKKAIELSPQAKIYGLSLSLALAAQSKWKEADDLNGEIYKDWTGDPRFDLALAVSGLKRKDLTASAKALEKFTPELIRDLRKPEIQNLWDGKLNFVKIEEIKKANVTRWKEIIHQPLLAEQYFYVLIWQERVNEAREFADAIADELRRAKGSAGFWEILAGDARFYQHEHPDCLRHYQVAEGDERYSEDPDLMGRFTDVYWSIGDQKNEQKYREKMALFLQKRLAGRRHN